MYYMFTFIRFNCYFILVNNVNLKFNFKATVIEYMAPELIKGEGYSYTLDWWTLGVLTYELVTGRSPFKSRNQGIKKSKITFTLLYEKVKYSLILMIIGEIPWPDPEKHKIYISKDMRNFIERLLDKDPENRLGVKGVWNLKLMNFQIPLLFSANI